MGGPSYYEFFAGGGMARAGLGPGWRCLFANDFDPRKARAYAENWGDEDFRLEDIHKLTADDLPGHADLAWASFPCQDLSLAGRGAGLDGHRSGSFRAFAQLIGHLRKKRRAPKAIIVENVVGLLTSNSGNDFSEICRTLGGLRYKFGALVLDASKFVPQSRPRLFIIAIRHDIAVPPSLVDSEACARWTNGSLRRAFEKLPRAARNRWIWWKLPDAPRRNVSVIDILDERDTSLLWHSREETARLVSLMPPAHRKRVIRHARCSRSFVATVHRRMRPGPSGKSEQRAEVRLDGIAGCLRTPAGGSSRQILLVVDRPRIRSRLLSAREAARLMGLPDSYKLPKSYSDAYKLLGDGVVAQVVSFLARNLLEKIVTSNHVRSGRGPEGR